ncbi:DUF6409 family protein [Streptomyces sp. NPDC056773]|uniref:DUF6409 family protein n=1 Tax=unclassified Streptomyces TaxID=2593676 RepID=UPI003696811C
MNTVTDFPAGTLVVTRPWKNGRQGETSPAVLLGPWGESPEATTVLVWFWTLGEPHPGSTVQAMFPDELLTLDDTLTTMHPAHFAAIEAMFPGGWLVGTDGEELHRAITEAALTRAADEAVERTLRYLAHI